MKKITLCIKIDRCSLCTDYIQDTWKADRDKCGNPKATNKRAYVTKIPSYCPRFKVGSSQRGKV